MKQLKSGKLTKGAGGMIIQTKTGKCLALSQDIPHLIAVTPVNNTTTTCVVTGNNLDPRLWKLLNLNSIPVVSFLPLFHLTLHILSGKISAFG